MTFRQVLIALLAVAVATMWGSAAYFYGQLPSEIPTHFNAEGMPDHVVHKTLQMWFALPVTFSVITCVFVVMAIFTPSFAAKYATLVNVPEKQTFVRLPVEARVRALEPMRDLSLMMPVPLALLAIYMSWGSTEVALGRASSLSPFPILFVLLSSFVCLGITVQRMQTSIRSEAARA